MKPIISVVSGTYNRLELLVQMVQSVRRAIPKTIPYELVIVDGGSTDGSLEWLRRQQDVRLIEHGELRGAIVAFTDGGYAAQGDYVILANDDITFHPASIMRAFQHLETHPACGAVAFMDNRPVNGVIRHKAQMQSAHTADGEYLQVIYAQVGMFRKWQGDMIGWWGGNDPIMSKSRTYGGDNWLSSKIWGMGYTVEIVDGALCDDTVVRDDLRAINSRVNDRAFYEAYPIGPLVGQQPQVPNPQVEHLRILYLPIYEPNHPLHKTAKRGLREALMRVGLVWEIDYLNEPFHLPEAVLRFRPHIVLTQLHDTTHIPLEEIEEARAMNPDMLLLNWNGDARGLTDEAYIDMLRRFDMQLVVNASALPVYTMRGIPAAYWQIGYEEPEFDPAEVDVTPNDIVFLGNCYNEARRKIEQALSGRGLDVAFYGQGWKQSAGDTLYNFAVGAAIYRKSKIAIGDTFVDGKTPVEAFVSNRVFQALAAGAFLLQQRSVNLEEFTGLKAGVHYVEWTTPDELPALIAEWLKKDKQRRKIEQAGQKFVLNHFSFDAQVKKLFADIVPQIEEKHRATA